MPAKNTISILENIKKKLHKFDQPRDADKKSFVDLGNEFEYISPSKNGENQASEPVKTDELKTNHDVIFEHEIENSFPEENSSDLETKESKADNNHEEDEHEELLDETSSEIHEDELEFDNHDEEKAHEEDHEESHDEQFDFPDELNLDEEEKTPQAQANKSPIMVEEDHHDDLDLETFPEEDLQQDESHDEIHEETEDLDAELLKENPLSPQENKSFTSRLAIAKQAIVSNVDKNISPEKQNVQPKESPKNMIEDDIDLDALDLQIKEDAKSEKPTQKHNYVNNFAEKEPTKPAQISKNDDIDVDSLIEEEDKKVEQEKSSVSQMIASMTSKKPVEKSSQEDWLSQKAQEPETAQMSLSQNNELDLDDHKNSNNSILNEQSVALASESVKKLIEAKNTVSHVESFVKSDAFAEIASKLMQPKLEKWLNDNLPTLVEKIVREEIKKIIPKE